MLFDQLVDPAPALLPRAKCRSCTTSKRQDRVTVDRRNGAVVAIVNTFHARPLCSRPPMTRSSTRPPPVAGLTGTARGAQGFANAWHWAPRLVSSPAAVSRSRALRQGAPYALDRTLESGRSVPMSVFLPATEGAPLRLAQAAEQRNVLLRCPEGVPPCGREGSGALRCRSARSLHQVAQPTILASRYGTSPEQNSG